MSYKTIYTGGSGEIEEKKSRFIATIIPINTEEEALAHIEAMKKKYWDARHNCYAYILGANSELERASDDGEPQKTAGQPILSVLQGQGLKNICCVVTRYFGGTLLGTGGLVRAYTDATKEGLTNCVIITKENGFLLAIDTDYTDMGKIQYLLATEEISTMSIDYGSGVNMKICVPIDKLDMITKKITDATSARAVITNEKEVIYADIAGSIKLFEN